MMGMTAAGLIPFEADSVGYEDRPKSIAVEDSRGESETTRSESPLKMIVVRDNLDRNERWSRKIATKSGRARQIVVEIPGKGRVGDEQAVSSDF
jgi:hypothetical protein